MHKYKYQSKVIDMFVSKVSQTLTVFQAMNRVHLLKNYRKKNC